MVVSILQSQDGLGTIQGASIMNVVTKCIRKQWSQVLFSDGSRHCPHKVHGHIRVWHRTGYILNLHSKQNGKQRWQCLGILRQVSVQTAKCHCNLNGQICYLILYTLANRLLYRRTLNWIPSPLALEDTETHHTTRRYSDLLAVLYRISSRWAIMPSSMTTM